MIAVVLLFIGAIVGWTVGEFGGAILGAAVGFLVGDRFAVMRRLSQVDAHVDELRNRIRALRDATGSDEPRTTTVASRAPAATRTAPPSPAHTEGVSPAAQPPPRAVPEAQGPSPAADEMHVPLRAQEPRRPAMPAGYPGSGSARPGAASLDLSEWPISRWVRTWFTTGNVVVKVGALILFVGVAFLVKYASEHTRIPVELRLSGVCLGAVALLAFGWRLRQRQRNYALILQGVGIAVLYLVVFAALRLYSLVPAGAAFLLLALLGVFSAVLAIAQNTMMLAMMGAAGGFLAPVLTSTGQGSHVVLFSYFAILDAGILAIAWFRSWRPLNLLGFVFTFGIGTAWGVLKYRPEHLASTEPFVILFFAFFTAIAVIFAFRQAPRFTDYVDGTLVFGTPVVAFALQGSLVRDIPYALAYSAAGVAAFYILLAWYLHTRRQPNLRLLVEAFLALGIAFATLAVPLALDGRWTAATWALEGAAILWVGIRQGRVLARVSGVLLQVGGGIAYALSDVRAPEVLPVLNSHFVGSVLVSGAGLISARLLENTRERISEDEQLLIPLFFAWGLAWWLFAGVAEINHEVPDRYFAATLLAFLAGTAGALGYLASRLDWNVARYPALCLLPAMVLIALGWFVDKEHFFVSGGYAAWPFALVVSYALLRRHEEYTFRWARTLLHAVSFWLAAFLLTGEAGWWVDRQLALAGAWSVVPWLIIPALFLLLLPRLASSDRWPFGKEQAAYLGPAAMGFQVYLVVATVLSNIGSDGSAAPLPYVPILNPLDIAQCFAFLAIATAVVRQRALGVPACEASQWRVAFGVFAGMLFVWLNAALLRTLHHWAGVPFNIDDMARSTLVQSSLSIFWTLIALGTMLWGTRRHQRSAWIAGAALMGVVVVKLVFVDLSNVGTVARIVSFVAVGLLMLVLGNYLRMPSASVARS